MDKLWLEKEAILNEVMDRLEERYPSGLYDFLHAHDRDLYARINEIEDALNKSFAEGGSIPDFKTTLREYWYCHMEGIKAFKASGQPEAPPEARRDRIAEREAAHA